MPGAAALLVLPSPDPCPPLPAHRLSLPLHLLHTRADHLCNRRCCWGSYTTGSRFSRCRGVKTQRRLRRQGHSSSPRLSPPLGGRHVTAPPAAQSAACRARSASSHSFQRCQLASTDVGDGPRRVCTTRAIPPPPESLSRAAAESALRHGSLARRPHACWMGRGQRQCSVGKQQAIGTHAGDPGLPSRSNTLRHATATRRWWMGRHGGAMHMRGCCHEHDDQVLRINAHPHVQTVIKRR